jgi:fructan beta-fructosidase
MFLENGRKNETKWVLYAADGKYMTGEFDGKVFKPDTKGKKQLWYGRFYAAQTFEPIQPPRLGTLKLRLLEPVIQIGWANGVTFPGMPFNQQMTVPVSLSLWAGDDGPRLAARPFGLENLHDGVAVGVGRPSSTVVWNWPADSQDGKRSPVLADNLETFDLETEIDPRNAKRITFELRGIKLIYDVAKQTLTCKDVIAPVTMTNPVSASLPNHLRLRVLMDRGSIEVFADGGLGAICSANIPEIRKPYPDGGLVAMSIAAIPEEKNRRVELHVEGDTVELVQLKLHRMKSSWLDDTNSAPQKK